MSASPHTVLYRFFQNFTGVMVMVWRYACGLDIILRYFFFLQVELSHFSSIIHNNFFCKLDLVIFQALYITKRIDRDILWAQLLLQFYTDSFETSLAFW